LTAEVRAEGRSGTAGAPVEKAGDAAVLVAGTAGEAAVAEGIGADTAPVAPGRSQGLGGEAISVGFVMDMRKRELEKRVS